MKANIRPHLATGLLAAIILSASLSTKRATAAEATEPLSPTSASRDTTSILREIELKISLSQYERVLSLVDDTKLQIALGPEDLSNAQIAEWDARQHKKLQILEALAHRHLDKIMTLNADANKAPQRFASLPIRYLPDADDSSPESLAAATQRGIVAAEADIKAVGKLSVLEYTSDPPRLITTDEMTGTRVYTFPGCRFSAQMMAEADAYNKTMRDWHGKRSKPTN